MEEEIKKLKAAIQEIYDITKDLTLDDYATVAEIQEVCKKFIA